MVRVWEDPVTRPKTDARELTADRIAKHGPPLNGLLIMKGAHCFLQKLPTYPEPLAHCPLAGFREP